MNRHVWLTLSRRPITHDVYFDLGCTRCGQTRTVHSSVLGDGYNRIAFGCDIPWWYRAQLAIAGRTIPWWSVNALPPWRSRADRAKKETAA